MTARKAYSDKLVDVYDDRHFGGESGQLILELDTQAVEALLPPPPALVLDIPCGTGAYTARLKRKGYRVIAADASLPMLRAAGTRGLDVPRFLGDINHLPLPAGTVDAVVVLRLFSHFRKDQIAQMLPELRRVIKLEGRVVFDTFRWSPRYWPGFSLLLDKSYIYPIRDREVDVLLEGAHLTKVAARHLYLFSPIWQRKLPVWLLRRLTRLASRFPQQWLLRRFWACTRRQGD